MIAMSETRWRFNREQFRYNGDSDTIFIEHERNNYDSVFQVTHWKILIYSIVILSLSIAISRFIFSIPAVSTYSYYFSRYLYFVPVLIAGLLVGRAFAVLVGLICGALFAPNFVHVLSDTGLSPEAIELGWLIALYTLIPLFAISLTNLTRQHTEVLNTVEQLGHVIEKSLDLNGLLSLVLKQSSRLLDADGGAMFVSFDETSQSRHAAHVELQGNIAHDSLEVETSAFFEWLLHSVRSDNAITIPNMTDDPRFVLPPDLIKMRPTCVAVRLRRLGAPFGLLVLWRFAGRNFTQDEIDLLRVLIDKTQMAVENAWLYSRTDEALLEYANDLTMLLEASREFTTAATSDELLQELCDQLFKRAEVTFCHIYLLDEETQSLVRAATRSVDEFTWYYHHVEAFSLTSLPLHQEALQTGKPLIAFNDRPKNGGSTLERLLLFASDAKSTLLIPLSSKDRDIGLIALGERRAWERSAFSKDRIERCVALARQATLNLENMEAFEALARQRKSIQLLLDNVTDGVFSTDLEGRITEFNPAAERITGYSANDVLGRTCDAAFSDREDSTCQLCWGICPIDRVLADPDSHGHVTHNETEIPFQDETKPITVTVAPLNDQQANTVGTVIVLRDISREQELVRLKTEFISMASHQLRTPLACIRTAIELLTSEDIVDDEQRSKELLNTLDRQSSHLNQLIDQVLTASRLEHGKFQPAFELLALVPLVTHLLNVYRSQYPNYTFVFEPCNDSLFARGDQMSVEIILDNLLENAVKYSPEGGKVTVTIQENTAYISIGVHDCGSGILKNQMAHIFQPFRQLSNYMTADTDGFGLGLYIAKTLVEAHGGEISVESSRDSGTTFTFTLPQQEVCDGENISN